MEERIMPERSKNIDILITLLTVLAMSCYYYGVRVLLLAACAIVCSAIADYVSIRVDGGRRWLMNDFSQVTTALILTCLLPASAPYWLPAIAAVIAVGVAKLPFGGYGKNIFNPAAVAYAFVSLCWPDKVLLYPQPFSALPLQSDITVDLVAAPSHTLTMGGVPRMAVLDGLLGNFAGPLGASCVLVVLMCGVYMIARRTISWRTVVSALATVVLITLLFPRTTAGVGESILNELFSGVLVFVVIFMANDPVTRPKTGAGQLLGGVALGIAMMIFRYFGSIEVGEIYALLLINAFCDRWDVWAELLTTKFKAFIAACKGGKQDA